MGDIIRVSGWELPCQLCLFIRTLPLCSFGIRRSSKTCFSKGICSAHVTWWRHNRAEPLSPPAQFDRRSDLWATGVTHRPPTCADKYLLGTGVVDIQRRTQLSHLMTSTQPGNQTSSVFRWTLAAASAHRCKVHTADLRTQVGLKESNNKIKNFWPFILESLKRISEGTTAPTESAAGTDVCKCKVTYSKLLSKCPLMLARPHKDNWIKCHYTSNIDVQIIGVESL